MDKFLIGHVTFKRRVMTESCVHDMDENSR